MGLNAPIPGLRPLHYNSNQPSRVELRVPPGDVLIVSEAVAAQLQAADSHFRDAPVVTIAAVPKPDNSREVRATLTGDTPQDLDEIGPDAGVVKAPRASRKKA